MRGGAIAALERRLGFERPPLAWTLRGYRRRALRGDLVAGVTVAALIVPLSIGYAQVAGLPPEAGLYASLVPLLAYAVFGSARRLVIGPDAATAALVGASIVPLAALADDRMRLASALALLVALTFIVMRLAALGFLADFLSRPILVGYMTGVGISVAVDQIPKILGGRPLAATFAVITNTDLTAVAPGVVLEAIGVALADAGINGPSLVVGGLVLAAVLAGDRLLPGIPVALAALIAALVASVALDLPARGVQVLGPVPSGLPPIALPLVSIDEAIALLPGALGIAVLSFADTVLTGRSFAARHGEETDPDRELVALAAADLGGSLTSGYPVSSSPSRTAAAEASGATTQLTGIVAAGTVALVLVFLAGYLRELPIPALGAVVLTSALRFIDLRGVRRIWRIDRVEGAIAIAAIAGVILYGTLAGVGIAAGLAALNVFRRAAQPRIDELGVIPESGALAALSREPAAQRVPGVLVVRFAGPLFFATINPFRARLRELLSALPDTRRVVIDGAPIVDVDLTAADGLAALQRELEGRGIELILARPTGAERDLLRSFGLERLAGTATEARRPLGEVVMAPLDGARSDPDQAPTQVEGIPDPVASAELPSEAGPPPDEGRRRWPVGAMIIGAVIVAALVVAVLSGKPTSADPSVAVAPNLIGLTLDRARIATSDAGLVLGQPLVVPAAGLPESTVIAQDPEAGTTMAPGGTVIPTVSTRQGLVEVPDVAGLPEAQALVSLTSAGLTVGATIHAIDTGAAPGTVVATDPPSGRPVAAGSTVALVVAARVADPSAAPPAPAPTRDLVPTTAPSPSASPAPSLTASPGTSPVEPSSAPPATAEPAGSASPDVSPEPSP